MQGDVVAIYDSNGAKVLSFTYDAWGNFTANAVNTAACTNFFIEATLFRYRGYIYDYELGLYYLQSRYYDPETGRFLNAEGVSYLGADGTPISYNLYAYCGNNPIMYVDPTGEFAEIAAVSILAKISATITAVAPVIGVAIGVVLVVTVAAIAIDQTFNTTNCHIPLNSAEDDLGEIAGKYGNLQCLEAQKAMTKYLKKNNKHGNVIQIKYEGDYIYSNSRDMVVSQNGFHTGVEYEGMVYCNIHPYGLKKELWLEDFDGVGQRRILEIPF